MHRVPALLIPVHIRILTYRAVSCATASITDVTNDKRTHTSAQKGTFTSSGSIPLTIRLPNGFRFTHSFRVADIATELIIGSGLLKRLGGVINFVRGQIVCVNANKCKIEMTDLNEWGKVSKISSRDFLGDDFKTPDFFQKLFPGKSVHEIAQQLDRVPPERDLTQEQGREMVLSLLENEFKCITTPLEKPTPCIDPVSIPFKKGHEDVVVNVPPRRRSSEDWEKVEAQVKEWLRHGKVEPSTSEFNTPHVMAPKSTPPFFRLAQDFRRLNEVIQPMKFPTRKIEEMVEEISNKKFKSTIDQDQAYTQIPVKKGERRKLAFSTRDGKYHFTVLPYGLVISGDLYCERKRKVLSYDGGDGLMWRFWNYVDDDCVASNTVIAQVFLLMMVFQRFKRFGFTIRMAKCVFIKITVEYGGHLVGYKEIRPNPKKAAMVAKISTPTSLKELRSFLQQASWVLRRFEPSFVDMACRLSSAFRKPNDRKPFKEVWNSHLQEAFDAIKASLAKDLVNATFDQECPDTHLWFDWSKVTAAVLSQHGKIVQVWGRSCTVAESNYGSVKGEALAFKEAQVHFRPYLLSLKFFYAVTDHRPLLGFDAKADLRDLDPMHIKWRESTEMYRSRRKLLYVMGSRNLADFWSRLWPHKPLPMDSLELSPVCVAFSPDSGDFSLREEDKKQVEMLQRNGLVFEDLRSHMRTCIHKSWRVYVPVRMRSPLILSLHLPRHLGEKRLKEKLSGHCFPKKKALVADFCVLANAPPRNTTGILG